jgi:GntR family transcriptional repressor for pyruvate dehydrogenase complex
MSSSRPERSRAGLSFAPVVRRARLPDQVADSILQAIVAEDLRPGDPLPSQRDLGEQFGVSRTVVREAVGSLVARGVIEVRSGSGLRLAAVDASSVAEAMTQSMTFFVRVSEALDYSKVHEVRRMVETHMAALAAERATEADVAQIRQVGLEIEQSDDPEIAAERDLEFHRAIARATQNELHLVLLDSIRGALLDIRRTLIPRRRGETAREHRAILARIVARDPEGARVAMQDHLDGVERASHDAERSKVAAPEPTTVPS